MKTLSKWVQQLKRSKGKQWLPASAVLSKMGGKEVVTRMASLLASRSALVRNRAALVLRELGDKAAVPALVRAIKLPANRNYRGTLIYALQTHDCSDHFGLLFGIALNGSYEASTMAYDILIKQRFRVSKQELGSAKRGLANYTDPALSPGDLKSKKAELARCLKRLGSRK